MYTKRTKSAGTHTAPCKLVCGLLLAIAAATAQAQQPFPQTETVRKPVLRTPTAPGTPTLIGPADNHQIQATSGVPTQTFTWDPPAGGPAVTFYRFQFENADDPSWTGPPPQRIDATAGRVSTQQIIPPALANARIRWSVRACNDAPVLTVAGSPGGNCGPAASRILSWSTLAQPPRLLQPAAGAARLPNESFTWSTSAGADSYLLCISKPGVACPTGEVSNASTLVVRRVGNSSTVAAPNTARFLGQTVNWTVAACSGGTCRYQQQFRPVYVGGDPPTLQGPASGTIVRSHLKFEWNPVPWATHYALCVSKPGVACPARVPYASGWKDPWIPGASKPTSSTADTHLYVTDAKNTSSFVDLKPMEGERHWTVAACSKELNYCRYQPAVRSISIRPRWNVAAKVTQVEVHDRCDNISPGDWNLSLFLSAPSDSGSGRWPGERGSRDVENGSIIATPHLREGLQAFAGGLADNETVTLLMTGVDCDSEGVWTLGNVFSGIPGVINVVRNWTVQCGGEEVQEVTFENDLLGEITHSVRLQDHVSKGSFFERTAVRAGNGDCGNPGAYTATIEISGERF